MKDYWITAIIFVVVFLGHSTNRVVMRSDSRWTLPVTVSILREGNIDLDEFKQLIEKDNYYAITQLHGHLYYYFPIGTSLLVLPLVFVVKWVCGIFSIDLFHLILYKSPARAESYIASIIVALTACILYLIGRNVGNNKWRSLSIVLIFAFCTSAWSTASRALWQHGPSMLMLSISLYLMIKAKDHPNLIQFMGLPLAFSYIVRPTNIIALTLLSLYVFIRYRRYIMVYLIGVCIILIPFAALNMLIYRSVLPPYYLPERLGSNPHFFEALFGNLFSAARGLFIFSPILILSLWGVYLQFRKGVFGGLDYFLLSIILLHWIAISSFQHWWAGYSYGPRFFADMLPFLSYYLFPAFAELSRLTPKLRALAYSISLILTIFSFWVHAKGVTFQEVHMWNIRPRSIDEDPKRLWDWRDLQFLR